MGFLLTESGNVLTAENGDRLLLEDSVGSWAMAVTINAQVPGVYAYEEISFAVALTNSGTPADPESLSFAYGNQAVVWPTAGSNRIQRTSVGGFVAAISAPAGQLRWTWSTPDVALSGSILVLPGRAP